MHPAESSLALQEMCRSLEASLGSLHELALDTDIGSIATVGSDGQPVTMVSRAWSGGPFRLVRTTLMESPSRIKVFNLVAYPLTSFEAPVFATDIVLLRDTLRIGVIDAMPLFAQDPCYHSRWVAPFVPLGAASTALAPRFDLKLEWSRHYLSEAACLATGLAGNELTPLVALWQKYWDLYLSLVLASRPLPPESVPAIAEWHRFYNEEHATVELKRNPLMRYFGEAYGHRFITGFLFSDSLGVRE